MTVNVAIAQINSTVGDLAGNSQRIADFARRAATQGADIVLTPELSLVGYPPEDLLLRRSFYAKSDLALQTLAAEMANLTDLHVIVGHPLTRNDANYNVTAHHDNYAVSYSYTF
jgi:NAD+ synthase (glutamine-hydrolysing)